MPKASGHRRQANRPTPKASGEQPRGTGQQAQEEQTRIKKEVDNSRSPVRAMLVSFQRKQATLVAQGHTSACPGLPSLFFTLRICSQRYRGDMQPSASLAAAARCPELRAGAEGQAVPGVVSENCAQFVVLQTPMSRAAPHSPAE